MTSSLELTQSDALTSASVLHQWADLVISEVENQSDERLIDLARDANSLEKSAFRVRGACAAELKRRLEKLQVKNIGKEMSRLAKEIGVGAKTLDDDARIYQVFSDHLRADTELDREYFRNALSAPDPQQAIAYAFDAKAQNETFSTRDFREYVLRLNGGEDREKLEGEHWVKVLLLNGADEDLKELCKHRNQDINTAVSQAIKEAADYSREKK